MKFEITHTIDLASILRSLEGKDAEKAMRVLVENADMLILQKLYTNIGIEISERQSKEKQAREDAEIDPVDRLLSVLS